jgi:hypothetical protein
MVCPDASGSDRPYAVDCRLQCPVDGDAVLAMSRYLKEYKYGSSPTGAQVLKTRTIEEQTFYVVKLVFPRGDAASLLFGFNAEGKITGINLMRMAGD